MSISIFQTNKPRDGFKPASLNDMLRNVKSFDFGARINTEDLEEAFRLSNSINSNWTENEEVTVTPEGRVVIVERGGLRSTMVGDVFAVDGDFFFVDMFGFKKLEAES